MQRTLRIFLILRLELLGSKHQQENRPSKASHILRGFFVSVFARNNVTKQSSVAVVS